MATRYKILTTKDGVVNQTHSGEVTGATELTIATAAVTLAKLANMATASLLGRNTAGVGAPEVISDIPTAVTIGSKYVYRADGTDIPIADGGTGQSTAQAAIDALSAVLGATNEHVLTKDTVSGNAIFKVAAGAEDFYVKRNLQVVDANYTLGPYYNGSVVGPITINNGILLTITNGCILQIL